MSLEAQIIPKEHIVKGAVMTTVFVAAAGGILAAREISRQRTRRQLLEAREQAAGDGNYVTTLEEVMRRKG